MVDCGERKATKVSLHYFTWIVFFSQIQAASPHRGIGEAIIFDKRAAMCMDCSTT